MKYVVFVDVLLRMQQFMVTFTFLTSFPLKLRYRAAPMRRQVQWDGLPTQCSSKLWWENCSPYFQHKILQSSGQQPTLPMYRGSQIKIWTYKLVNLAQVFRCIHRSYKKETISFITSACLSTHMEQLGSHWMDFREMLIVILWNLSKHSYFIVNHLFLGLCPSSLMWKK